MEWKIDAKENEYMVASSDNTEVSWIPDDISEGLIILEARSPKGKGPWKIAAFVDPDTACMSSVDANWENNSTVFDAVSDICFACSKLKRR